MTACRRPRPPLPSFFRRRMILQLTSLLDLLLIIVFVQYLEMQQSSARMQSQRDRLLSNARGDLYQVWDIHINGNRSIYPDGSLLITSPTQKKIFQPDSPADLTADLLALLNASPRPSGEIMFVLTWGNVRRDLRDQTESRLNSAIDDPRLKSAFPGAPVKYRLVEGGYLEEPSP